MKQSIRNIIIFAVIAIGGGFVGAAINNATAPADPMQGLGTLVWLAAPLAANLLLRAFGGDGWKDFYLKPRLKQSWRWYLVALLAVPVIVLILLGVGALFGATAFDGFAAKGLGAFLAVVGLAFAGNMVKNIFEEFSWRGYLAPRFEALGLHPFVNALLTGLIWAAWHIPYYLYFLDRAVLEAHSSLPLPVFIAVSFLLLPFQALAYNELYLLSKSIWTVWLLHNVANAISLPLLTEGFVSLKPGFAGTLFSPGTEGILHAALMGALGLFLYQQRRRKEKI